jgi:hypothetical protein
MSKTEHDQKISFFLARKLELSRRYLTITKRMEAITSISQMAMIQGFMAQRKQCADRIDDADMALERLFKPGPTGAANTLLHRFSEKTVPILEEAAAIEKKIVVWMSNQQKALKSELLILRKGRQAVRGYFRPDQKTARCLDTFR